MTLNQLDLVVLKTIITSRKYALEYVHDCNEKLFQPDLWRFVKFSIDYIRAYKEVPTKRVLLERAAGNSSLTEYINTVFSKLEGVEYDIKEYKHDLDKLKTRYAEKLIGELKDKLNKQTTTDVNGGVNELQSVVNNIRSINQVKAYDQGSLRESIEDFHNRYIAKKKDPNYGIGIPTGYSFLDFTLCGLRSSEMFLIAGPTGGGKSLMLMNMAINMWLQGNTIDMKKDFKKGYDILYFSLEMPKNDMEERIFSRLSMVPQKSIRDAKLNDIEEAKLDKAMQFASNYPHDFEIVDVPRGATIETIELIFNDVALRRKKPQVVVIDYLALMDHKDQTLDDWLKMGKIAEQLHEFTRVHEIVMLSAVQVNDPKLDMGKNIEQQIGLHRIGRSKLIMHNANFGLQIEKTQDSDLRPDLNLHLIKSRRTELVRGKAYKNYTCCALLNDPFVEEQSSGDIDDISNKMEFYDADNRK